jgi:hypothetical protein
MFIKTEDTAQGIKETDSPDNKPWYTIFPHETMFRSIHMMTQIFLNQLQRTRMIMVDTKLRDMFTQIQKTETDILTKMVTYGRLKGWLHLPPRYKG